MQIRKQPFVNGEIYHVFTRGVAKLPIFLNKNDYRRAMFCMNYYRYTNPPLRYSYFKKLSSETRSRILSELVDKNHVWVEIIAFCLMPNHIHWVFKQVTESGITKYMKVYLNSHARYFNKKNHRVGPLFQGRFKAVRIESDKQLMHMVRYVHLNPTTSYIVNNFEELINYQYSSLPEYLGLIEGMCDKRIILDQFKTIEKYKEFLSGQVDYQRNLGRIKHLLFD